MSSIDSLKHTEQDIKGGGKIVILNTGAVIGPEAEAMLQALNSRSIGGIKSNLKALIEKGPEKFISTYYVGYGHKSIGDCGTCTIFIENVSMFAAKAIQQWPLYSGQEASTRYIDFAQQPFVDPVNTSESKKILENWRAFYLKGLKGLDPHLKEKFTRKDGEDEKMYDKAIKARAFDIMRSFLPSGATTNLAWHTNFRQAADHIMRLRHHPLEEVRSVADALDTSLNTAFPSSFGHKQYEATEEFNKNWMQNYYYYQDKSPKEFELVNNSIDRKSLKQFSSILKNRPAKTELPKELAECGTMQFKFLLDFGSFRDLQRHRAVTQQMPLVVMDHGFNEWCLEELPESFRKVAQVLISQQEDLIKNLECTPEIKQYYIPMGYKLPNKLTGSLPALVYLAELRATRFVHNTLRKRAIEIAKTLEKEFADEGLVIHLDKDPDRFDIKRGSHDIVEKI